MWWKQYKENFSLMLCQQMVNHRKKNMQFHVNTFDSWYWPECSHKFMDIKKNIPYLQIKK